MTVIIGLEHKNKVYMGGDSISLSGWSKAPIAGEKVFKRSFKSGTLSRDFIFGFAGSPRAAQLVEYRLQPPVISDAAELASKFPVSIDDLALAARWAALLSTEGVNLPDVMRRYLGSNPSLALRLSIAIGGLDQLAEMCVPISQVYPDRSETVTRVLEGLTLDAQKFQEYTASFAKEQNEGDQ